MFRKIINSIIICFISLSCFGQQDSLGLVKYNSDFHFKDGVYANFNEWKNNEPRLRNFEVVKTNSFGARDEFEIFYSCLDTAGSPNTCKVNNCFGYVKNGSLYFSQGFYGTYFRVFIIGGLTHFLAFNGYEDQNVFYSSDPSGFLGSANDYKEYVLDFYTGEAFLFTYKNFVSFLKERDTELCEQLLASKNKRQMIHHFMLKYNERHPIYLPVD